MRTTTAVLLCAITLCAWADDRAEYGRRAAAADMAAFRQLDLNGDGRLTREEATGDVNFAPRFNDMDINRDGVLTHDELLRYIRQTYGADTAG